MPADPPFGNENIEFKSESGECKELIRFGYRYLIGTLKFQILSFRSLLMLNLAVPYIVYV